MPLTVGSQLRSTTSTCEVVVVRAPGLEGAVYCGEAEMTSDAAGRPATGSCDGPAVVLGKRYEHKPSGLELLCVKPGPGPLTFDGVELVLKSAKPLPASD
ncbi:hypothetical protein ACFWP5_19990 [Streptomyces sp. NPDC058469]|uniref:hypothetical protein n=1 Tax=Streptomyces sp. NPDC058469 TaxID=3346514 RepID=UPI00364CCF61